jgi:predicted dehydrogenase
MNIGIIGAGGIASTMAVTLAGMDGAAKYAIASRDIDKAKAFAEKYGFEKAYGSYEDLAKDENVDLVYIATPHSEHFANAMLCVENGRPVLCEKAFTVNAGQARALAEAARSNGVFVTEAIWPRYQPSRKLIDDLIASGIIGKVDTLTANLSYTISGNRRLIDPALAGGALLDLGVYGINFALMHFGKDIEHIESSVVMTDTGVDGRESITLIYRDGRIAVLTHGIFSRSDRKGIFYGDKGYMVVENINNPNAINVFDTNDNLIKHVDVPKQITGYEYEVYESMDCIKSGLTESRSMPLDESVFMLGIMDRIREGWGLKYPFEQ